LILPVVSAWGVRPAVVWTTSPLAFRWAKHRSPAATPSTPPNWSIIPAMKGYIDPAPVGVVIPTAPFHWGVASCCQVVGGSWATAFVQRTAAVRVAPVGTSLRSVGSASVPRAFHETWGS